MDCRQQHTSTFYSKGSIESSTSYDGLSKITSVPMINEYQVGGSLNVNASSYVVRQADSQLYQTLLRGEFCYIFNSRQMGKSSLRVRVKNTLESQGYACVSLDMTNIGSKTISPLQWYKSIASELWRGFNLIGKVKFKSWWESNLGLSPIQQLNLFISEVVLPSLPAEKIFIFIDEIDSVISLDFPTDDFFALIRYFYNARAENQEFNRLSFALFGVATPSDLIADHTRTPFNIGTGIELTGFTLDEATPLIDGLQDEFKHPEIVLQEILNWTGGQPFLTQKLCKLALQVCQATSDCLLPGGEVAWVKDLVTENVINNWGSQDEPEHLRTIRDRLLRNEQKASRLLGLAEQIFRNGFIDADDSPEQRDLLLSNLVVKKSDKLVFRNLIYQKIFNLDWIEQQQEKLRPYGKEVDCWLASQCQDTSRLLRGQTLQEAQIWASSHNISQEEYQFLTASQEQKQQEIRQNLELERLQAIETRLFQEQKLAKAQRFFLGTVGAALAIAAVLGITAYWNYVRAKIKGIEAYVTSSNNLFDSDRRFDALIDAIKAKKETLNFIGVDDQIDLQTDLALRQATYSVIEKNTFSGHRDIVLGVSISPDDKLIASASADTTIKIWQRDGKLRTTLEGHKDSVLDVTFSPDGTIIASASEDNTVKLWNLQGKLLKTLSGHRGSITKVAYCTKNNFIATASEDKTVKLWDLNGNLLSVLEGHEAGILEIAFSHDGQIIATGDRNGTLKLWNHSGKLLDTFATHNSPLRGIDFSLDDRRLVTGGDDDLAKIWQLDGTLIQTLSGYDAPVTDVEFSPDGNVIGTSSWDGTVKLWSIDGMLLSNSEGHQGRVWRFAWSGDGSTIVSAGWDNVVKLWQLDQPLVKTFYGHTSSILSVAFHPQNKFIASASVDGTVKLWRTDGSLFTNFTQHSTEAYDVAFSGDGELVASTSYDHTIKLWRTDGTVVASVDNIDTVTDVNFAPDGKTLISGGYDTQIQFWELQKLPTEVKVIPKQVISSHQARITDINISQDGKLIASVSHDRYLRLWKSDGNLIKSIFADKTGVRTVAISPDQEIIATGGKEQNVKIWNTQGDLINTLEGHQAIILDVEFSPDGKLIASASADKTVKIWNRQGKLLTTLRGHKGRVWNIDFSPDSKQIVTAAEDKQIKLWDLERILELDTLNYACNWVEDYLKTNADLRESDRNLCKE